MTCADVNRWLDDAAEAAPSSAVSAHLRGCAACSDAVRAEMHVRAALENAPAESAVRAAREVMQRIARERRARSLWREVLFAPGVVAAGVFAVSSAWWGPHVWRLLSQIATPQVLEGFTFSFGSHSAYETWALVLSLWPLAVAFAYAIGTLGGGAPGARNSGVARPGRSC